MPWFGDRSHALYKKEVFNNFLRTWKGEFKNSLLL